MTLMYTFSRRAGLVRRIIRVEGLRSALLARSCPLRGTAASPVLPPSWRRYQPDAASFTVPPPTRCCHQHGTVGRGRAINRYVTFLYRGF